MKGLIIAALAVGLAGNQAFGQGAQGAKITQRARDLANQNNANEGASRQSQPAAPPSAPPAQPQKAVAPSPAQIQQQHINRIRNDIGALLAGTAVSPEKVKKLSADLTSASRGAKKASPASINKLASSIATHLAGKTLGSAEQLRLATDLEAVVNGSGFSSLQTEAYISDVQSIVQKAGVNGDAAAGIASDVKAAVLETQH